MPAAAPSRDPGMETPIAPLPAPDADGPATAPRARGPLARALRSGCAFALRSWRPILAVVLVQLLLGLTIAAPFAARMGERVDRLASPADVLEGGAPGWGAGLEPGAWLDLRRVEASFLRGLSATFVGLALLAWLFGAVAAGGFLGTAVTPETPPTAGRFFAQGGRWLGRMLRVGLVVLAVLYAGGRLLLEAWAVAAEAGEKAAASQGAAWWGARIREGAFVLLFLVARVAGDLARADLVVFARRSAVLAFGRALLRIVRHPVATFGLALAVGLPAFGLVLLATAPFRATGGTGWAALLGLFLLVQAAVAVRWASRAALLAGDVRLVEGFARPARRSGRAGLSGR